MDKTMLTAAEAKALVDSYNLQNSLQIKNSTDIYNCCVQINDLITSAANGGLNYITPYQTDNFTFGNIPVEQTPNAMQIINASFSAIGYQIAFVNRQNPLADDNKIYVYGW